MKQFILYTICALILLVSCKTSTEKKTKDGVAYEYYSDGVIKSETEVKDTLAHGLMKNYDRDGNLLSVYTFNMGKLSGPAVSYYSNGQLEQKMFYKDGKREGTSQWYYSTGELYRVIPYKNGKIDGIKISYYKDGTIMSEAHYLGGFPGTGLQEYNMKGELLKDDTKIIIREENKLFSEGKFILHLSLSPEKSGAAFYMGDLEQVKFISPDQWQLPEKDGNISYTIALPKGGFRMETIVFSASYKTSKSNINVITRKYNLAIDNK